MAVDTASANGANIPKLGFGTWQLQGQECRDAVAKALAVGYRHIDTAAGYDNEEDVGTAVRESGLPRDQVFVTTKIWLTRAAAPALRRSAEKCLQRLNMDHVDLLLMHWWNAEVPLAETMGALCEVKRQGKTRNIGVSNFTTGLIKEAAEASDEPLAVDQVEYHPFLSQKAVLRECRARGMALTAYSPIAKGTVNEDATLREIAEAHGKTPIQVTLRWLYQQDDVVAIPRSSKPDHIGSNFDIFNFELSDDEMRRIHGLARPDGRMVDPSWAPEWD